MTVQKTNKKHLSLQHFLSQQNNIVGNNFSENIKGNDRFTQIFLKIIENKSFSHIHVDLQMYVLNTSKYY